MREKVGKTGENGQKFEKKSKKIEIFVSHPKNFRNFECVKEGQKWVKITLI